MGRCDSLGGGAIFPSSVIAAFSVISGVCWRMYLAKASFSILASSSKMPEATEIPALRSRSKPFPDDQRIGILHASHHATNAGRDDGVGARPGAALMRARFEIDVENSAAGLFSGLLERENFGVLDAVKGMRALADDLARAIHDHGAHAWVGRG